MEDLVAGSGERTQVVVRAHSVEIMACACLVIVVLVDGLRLVLSVGRIVLLGRQAAVTDFSVRHGVIVREYWSAHQVCVSGIHMNVAKLVQSGRLDKIIGVVNRRFV